MTLNDLEHHAMAYYATTQANDLKIADRFYPYGELVMIIADKIQVAVRQFGPKAGRAANAAATAFVDTLIAKGGWSTTQNKFGGSMHQYQTSVFPKALKELQANDPVIQRASAEGEGYWANAFAELTA
jgi:hypothetical protein